MSILQELRNNIDNYTAQNIGRFRFWHVEALLNQSADLLDRCLLQRQYLRTLEEKRLEIKFRIVGMKSDRKTENGRVTSGFYKREATLVGETAQGQRTQLWNELVGAGTMAKIWFDQGAGSPDRAQREAEWHTTMAARHIEDANRAMRDAILPLAKQEGEDSTTASNARQNAIGGWLAGVYAHEDKDEEKSVLYLDYQIDSERKAILDDFEDAFDRANVASDGLHKLYGYSNQLPQGTSIHSDTLSLLDTTSLWVRQAIRWLTAILQYDQVFTISCSLKKLASQDFQNFSTSFEQLGHATIAFHVPLSLVDGHSFVRLRGISLIGNKLTGTISAKISLPKTAQSFQPNDLDSKNIVILHQEEFPKCLIGRVADGSVVRAPEVAGSNSILNASPFGTPDELGKLELAISSNSGDQIKFKDFYVEMTLAGRPSK